MDDLFRKLNTLVRARASDVLGDPLRSRRDRTPSGRALDAEVERLRQQINAAIDREDQLKEKISKMQQEADLLDIQADEALVAGNEAQARHLVERMQRVQRLIEMARSDLNAHQMAASDLIRRVNLLEATVADVRQQAETPPAEPTETEVDNAAEETPTAESVQRRIDSLSNVVKQAQERIARTTSEQAAQAVNETEDEAPQSLQQDASAASDDNDSVEDDLSARRNRLSRR
jgi:phage shock protein A